MQNFILFFRRDGFAATTPSPRQMQNYLQQWIEWTDNIKAQNKFISGIALDTKKHFIGFDEIENPETALPENGNTISGLVQINAGNFNEAIEIAKLSPVLHYGGIIEIREINI
jgi:hypothetical protein